MHPTFCRDPLFPLVLRTSFFANGTLRRLAGAWKWFSTMAWGVGRLLTPEHFGESLGVDLGMLQWGWSADRRELITDLNEGTPTGLRRVGAVGHVRHSERLGLVLG
jgi:hypothetical protein